MKKEQLRKAEERKRILVERTGTPKDLSGMNEMEVIAVVKEYHERIRKLEGEKYDLEYHTARKDYEVRGHGVVYFLLIFSCGSNFYHMNSEMWMQHAI